MSDHLTNLPGRQDFWHHLRCVVEQAAKRQEKLALLVVDIQRFRRINSVYGYSAGDQTLEALAAVLSQVAREQDFAARISADQFALLLSGIANEGHAKLAALKIQRLLDEPLVIDGSSIRCATRIGTALFPTHATTAERLLKEAEQALDVAKQTDQLFGISENRYQDSEEELWDIEKEIDNAIDNDELKVFFQPKIDIASGIPVGAEALVRWQNPQRGLISPAHFLPVAEASGFIKQITGWMLNSALRLSGNWPQHWGKLEVSVNVPTRMLEQPEFLDLVQSACALWKQQHTVLCLEVLEQSLIKDVSTSFRVLKALRARGIRIAIDDFGTGYSNLSYFKDIPVDIIKIDQSFIAGLLRDQASSNIVSLIIDLAHKFGLEVVAEGVEDAQTLALITHLNCDQAQGYFYAEPLPEAEFIKWLKNYKPSAAQLPLHPLKDQLP
jgi:diguanylate cyclase (GGDEF)-like protein